MRREKKEGKKWTEKEESKLSALSSPLRFRIQTAAAAAAELGQQVNHCSGGQHANNSKYKHARQNKAKRKEKQ